MAKRNEPPPTIENLAARLAEVEKLLARITRCPTAAKELGMQKLHEETEALQRHADAEAAAKHARLKPERQRIFARFAAERLAFDPSLIVTELRLACEFEDWGIANGIAHDLRMDADELVEAVAALPGVARVDVHPPTYRGRGDYVEAGFAGCGLCPVGEAPKDVQAGLESERAETAGLRAERDASRARQARVEQDVIDHRAAIRATTAAATR